MGVKEVPLVTLELNNTMVRFELLEADDALPDVLPDLLVHLPIQLLGEEAHCLDVHLVMLLLLSLPGLRDLPHQDLGLSPLA